MKRVLKVVGIIAIAVVSIVFLAFTVLCAVIGKDDIYTDECYY